MLVKTTKNYKEHKESPSMCQRERKSWFFPASLPQSLPYSSSPDLFYTISIQQNSNEQQIKHFSHHIDMDNTQINKDRKPGNTDIYIYIHNWGNTCGTNDSEHRNTWIISRHTITSCRTDLPNSANSSNIWIWMLGGKKTQYTLMYI